MNNSAKPFTELINSTYQDILEHSQMQTAGLFCIALLNTKTGEYLQSRCGSADIDGEAHAWIGVAKELFCGPRNAVTAPFRVLTMTQQIHLQFEDQALVGVSLSSNTPPAILLVRESVALDHALNKAKTLFERFGSSNGNPSCFEWNGILVNTSELGSGSAEKICKTPELGTPLLEGLFGQAVMPNVKQLQEKINVNLSRLKEAYIETDQVKALFLRPRFLPDHVLVCVSNPKNSATELTINLRNCVDDVLRKLIGEILEEGINTDATLAKDDLTWQSIVQELRELNSDDLIGLLEVGGFANHSMGDCGDVDEGAVILRCAECIYYYPNRKWCDLPELPVPVEPHWYCKLWKL